MERPINVLRRYWGYPAFRPLQEEVIESALAGKDTLALLPTGGGKSICFQVPALCKPGIAIVVSPLIALMKDQVRNLAERNIPAAAIYSGMTLRDIDRVLDNCIYGNVKLLYLSPERLSTDLARERLRQMQVNFLVVDEAHCISQWGYDFRPSYLRIADIREYLPNVPVLALTATATPAVVEDIQQQLLFPAANVRRMGFERTNLAYIVRRVENKEEKLLEVLRSIPGSSVVYARNRRKTREIAIMLERRGISAAYYHAGLSPEAREQRQEAWIKDQIRVMVSTNAFGMGIDKPEVRTVIHMDVPDSLEAYFQEAGRAGRDGEQAYAVLLYQTADRDKLEHQFESSYPDLPFLRRIYRALGSNFQLATGAGLNQTFDFDLPKFCETYDLPLMTTLNGLKILEQSDWLTLSESVYHPASLEIKVSREQLYDYQLRNPMNDKIIKLILRNYQGAFSGPLFLRENRLARPLKMDLEDLQQRFRRMHQDGVIQYRPQRQNPQLTFTRARVNSDQLTIDHQLYQFRKNRQRERIDAMLHYVEDPICRSRQLLQYFGEEIEKNCGSCDVCRQPIQNHIDQSTYHMLRKKIRLLLLQEQLSTKELVASFAPRQEKQILQTLQVLMQEEEIALQGARLRWTGGK